MLKIRDRYKHLDVWAYFYICVAMFLPIVNVEFSPMLFLAYLIIAIPFVQSIEHFVVICVMLSTISYYFCGAYEQVYSIYSILALLIIINIIVMKKAKMSWSWNSLISMVLFYIITFISYYESSFGYTNGLYRMLFLYTISLLLGNCYCLNIEIICKLLPKVAGIMTVGYLLTLIVSGTFVDERLTIATAVNTNTFGMSCAQIGCILLVRLILEKKNRVIFAILFITIMILGFLSGSRGALLACILSCLIIILIRSKRERILSKTMFKIIIVGIVVISIIYLLITLTGIDVSRFSVSEILSSGGSRRVLIYTTLIPFIINNGYWKVGYGPGHDCSRRVIMSLIAWEYTHSHNTFLEAFGELGIIGLIALIVCVVKSINNLYKACANNKEGYVILAMLICLIINGFAESYFFDAILWLLLAVGRNKYDYSKGNA